MFQKIISNSITIALIAFAVFILVLFQLPFEIIKQGLDAISKNGADSFTETYFETHRFILKIISFILIISGLITFFIRKKLAWLVGILLSDLLFKINRLKKALIIFYTGESRPHFLSLVFILFVGLFSRIALLQHPFRYDEAFTYYSYVKTPFLLSMANYSYPNNHIFHTLLVQLSTFCFGESIIAIRIPALIAGIFLLPLSYFVIRKIYTKNIAIISMAFLSCSYPLIDYSVNARGYTIICFLFILLLRFSIKKNRNLADRCWIIFISALGFYTIPIFLYPFTVFLFWIFLKEGKSAIKELTFIIVCTCLISLVLYTPVFLYTGLNSFIDNEFIIKYEYALLPKLILSKLIAVFNWFSKGMGPIAFQIGTIGIILGLFSKNKNAQLLLLSTILGIICILIIQRVDPPVRVWIFLIPILIPYAINGLFQWAEKEFIPLSIACTVTMILSINIHLNWKTFSENQSIFEYDSVALQLKKVMSHEDQLIAKLPIDYPFEFYLNKYELPFSFEHVHNGGYPSEKRGYKNIYVLIDRKYNQHPQDLLGAQAANFSLLIKENSIEVYKVIE